MTRLEALKAALEAKREAYTAWDAKLGGPYSALDHAVDDAAMHLDDLLTDDTVAALIAVAEAAKEQNERYCAGITDENIDEEIRFALAQLVEEVPDDRA